MNGIAHAGLTRQQYEDLGGWNASLLKTALSKTPAHAYRAHLAPDRPVSDSPALRIGTLVHEALLEPSVFASHLVSDKGTRTKAYQIELEEAIAAGRRLVAADERDLARSIAASVRNHPILGVRFPDDGHRLNELSLRWDTSDGVGCRARLDALRLLPGSSQPTLWVGDLKTAADADPDEFGRSAVNFNYLLQAAFYSEGVRSCADSIASLLELPVEAVASARLIFEFVVIEKTRPYPVARYVATDDQLDLGNQMWRRAIQLVEAAKAIDYWPGYDYSAKPLELPPWAERTILRLTEGS